MSLPDPYYQDDAVTIYHGDCREILPELEQMDMVFTDPPYGHNNNDGDLIANWEKALGRGEPGKPRPIANDGREIEEILESILPRIRSLLRHGGCCCCCCCCGGGGPSPTFAWVAERMDRSGLAFFHAVVWDKSARGHGMGWRFRRNYELIMVAHRRGGRLAWADDGVAVPNVQRQAPPRDRRHPNEKPMNLVGGFIRWHTQPGDLVLDPCMGSGTTLESAKALGRKAIGIEIEERYCEIAAKRMAQEILL